jgi:hypothetical protein
MGEKEHTFEDSITEIKRHAEARRSHERYNDELSTKITYIKGLLTDDQLRTWRLVESIIERNVIDHDRDTSTVMKIYPDDLRKELLR